jgi:hypothetical protein
MASPVVIVSRTEVRAGEAARHTLPPASGSEPEATSMKSQNGVKAPPVRVQSMLVPKA